jgi:hypothetical protein
MATTPKQNRTNQLVLFGERPAVPHWRDLAESTRVEVVGLLAQLPLSIHAGNPSRAPQIRGERDE